MKQKITVKRKTKTIYKVYKEGKIWGILPEKSLLFFDLSKEKPTYIDSSQKIEEIAEKIERYAWEKLIHYLSYRERCEYECRVYLKRLPLNEQSVEILIKKAKKNRYIEDERYADFYTYALIKKNLSRREIYNRLREKRIAEEIIEANLRLHYTLDEKKNILIKMVKKALRKYRKFDNYTKYQKVMNYLARKGFNYNDAKKYYNKFSKEEQNGDLQS